MNKKYRLNFLPLLMTTLLVSSIALAGVESPKQMFRIGPLLKYEGLTQDGLKTLKQARDGLRQRFALFANEFKSLEAIHCGATLSRLCKANMFLYGPPGGGKSALIEWMFKGEDQAAFQLQLHQMITEQAFIGGQNFDKARLGEFEINTQSGLGNFKVALIDEIEKGNPGALAALLSLLNERKIMAGNQVIAAKTETVFATSNANLQEIFDQFLSSGQRSTAPALLNRFQIKALVYNWLSIEDQAALDERRQQRRYLKTIASVQPEAANNEIFIEPEHLDWDSMRSLANVLMRPSDLFLTVYREFVGEMRMETNKAVRESEVKHRQNRFDEPFVYFPACDFTERLRQQIPEVVIMSAFIDFLLSDLADDGNLERMTAKQIELGPLSLWRSFVVMTTLSPGQVRLVNDAVKQQVDIVFDVKIDEANARDEREIKLLRNIKNEQERFRQVFVKHMGQIKESIEQGSQFASRNVGGDDIMEQQLDLEFKILKHLRK